MTRRLLLSYLGVALVILVTLEIPIAVFAYRHEHDLFVAQVQREATGLAVVAGENLEHGQAGELPAIVAQYQVRTGGEVTVVDPSGRVLAASDSDRDVDARGEQRSQIDSALGGRETGTMISDEGQPTAVAAVPISGDGQAKGAVLVALSATGAQRRIHGVWLALVAFAAVVLAVTAVVGLWLARSLSRPLAELGSTVARLGAGELSARSDANAGPPQVRSLSRQFNHMAERLSGLVDAQSRFVADASHQLRSPLTALRLRLENLQSDLGSHLGRDVAAAGQEVQRLSRLVDGLLSLSRVDSDHPSRHPIDVEQVIQERCEAWSALADERHVDLQPQWSPAPLPAVEMVPGDLDQVLDNLLANALDASPPDRRIRVCVATAGRGASTAGRGAGATWRGSTEVVIRVIDQGPGMNADDRRRAFDRFWQAPGGSGRGHIGLGLAIVRQLIARNDGRVELRAAPNTGLEAVISLTASRRATVRTGALAPVPSGPVSK